MSLVLDGSITLSWYFEDELASASQAVLDQVVREGALVPALWRYEVANGLQIGVRRKRIDPDFRDRALANLAALSIDIDEESDEYAWSASVKLAQRHALTVYDAAYLELAQRRRRTLATLDTALIKAAGVELVSVVGPAE